MSSYYYFLIKKHHSCPITHDTHLTRRSAVCLKSASKRIEVRGLDNIPKNREIISFPGEIVHPT